MSRYDDARNRVAEILTSAAGHEEAARLLSDVIVGAYWNGAEMASGSRYSQADKYLREEK